MKLFHASHHEFDFPDYEKIRKNLTGHANGMLGLWVSVKNDWIDDFGDVKYEIVLGSPDCRERLNIANLSIGTLASWASKDEAFHLAKRQEFLAQEVDYLRLVEVDGRSEMGIVLNFSAIKSFTKAGQDDAEKSAPRMRCAS